MSEQEDEASEQIQRFWVISCGSNGEYASTYKKAGYVSIKWGEEAYKGIDNLAEFNSEDEIKEEFKKRFDLEYSKAAPGAAEQCWNFLKVMHAGDYVLGYGSQSKKIHLVGKVSGPYESKDIKDWAGSESSVRSTHRHVRTVKWLDVDAVSLPPDLNGSFENRILTEITETVADQILWLAGVPDICNKILCEMTAKPKNFFDTMSRRLLKKRQIVLYGPPGTSKTHIAKEFSKHFKSGTGLSGSVQFHPSYSYEDFIEGFRPNGNSEGAQFTLQSGVFKNFCEEAGKQDEKQRHVFIIDEINRGNLPQIFGELLYLLEYRGEETKLPYSKAQFKIPKNVYIIATMNSADRSIAMVDYALRRRFEFFDLSPDMNALKSYLENNGCEASVDKTVTLFKELNEVVAEKLGKHYQVGHAYFMKPHLTEQGLKEIWQFSISPLLEEYFFDDKETLESVTFEKLWACMKA